jgi:hypothetical protein
MSEPTEPDESSSAATPPFDASHVGDLEEWLRKFERRTYITFVSRARASERLGTRGMLWMIALSVASASALCASVISLANGPRPVSRTDLGTALFTLATLVLSLIVAALNYQARSRDLFHSFRAIQRVSSRVESLRERGESAATIASSIPALEAAYQDALDKSENHTTLDYHKARPTRDDEHKREDELTRRRATIYQGVLTAVPAVIIAVSLYWIVYLFVRLR